MNVHSVYVPPLVDENKFKKQLEATENPLTLFKDTLRHGKEQLRRGFEAGEPVTLLIKQHSALMDFLLTEAWQLKVPPGADAALVAVGGYGREELHPESDIDLLVLLGNGNLDTLAEPLSELLTFFFDIGPDIAHSVRDVSECVEEARVDITIATSLLEARLICGPELLFAALKQDTGPDRIWPSRDYFEAKLVEQRQRYEKYAGTISALEPNLKESPGGLRDVQTVGWVAKRHFGANRMTDMVNHGFITETEYWDLKAGLEWLFRIRFALHLLTGRHEDRILFDYQKTLSEQFGFQDDEDALGIEKFMQQYYQTAIRINRINEMLLQLFREVIVLQCHLDAPKPINKYFQSRSGYLEAVNERVFLDHPLAMLELFLVMEQHPELNGVRASTIRLIRSQRETIDDDFRSNDQAKALFMEILRQPQGITHELRRMHRYGILSRYIPAFANIVGRMQYDLFHVYTVDEHTLFVIRNLRRFMIEKHRGEFPLCSDIMDKLHKPELLFLAALFHDIAKGRGGDHSLLGSEEARKFCINHNLEKRDANLVGWLVERHLLMSITAQRKDISDPDVIYTFAKIVGNPIRLDYLYLLTIADMRATDPKKWNNWKNSLLRELYYAARHTLLRGLQNPQERDEIIQNKQAGARHLLKAEGISSALATAHWRNLSLDYFVHHSWEEIAWQTRMILTANLDQLPLVLIRRAETRGGSEVFIYTRDRKDLFALTTSLLDQLGLNIVSARIETADTGFTINSFLVLEGEGSPIEDRERKEEILLTIEKALRAPDKVDLSVSRRVPRQLKYFSTPTRVDFAEDHANQRTIMKLGTSDRPGLLSQIGYAFAACGIRLINAKIATIGAEADDTFFITDMENRPITNDAQLKCLELALKERLDTKSSAA